MMACPQGKTKDGFETQFGTNHLGHFLFVNRIAPLIEDGGRVVVLSSAGHRYADVDLDDPGFERTDYAPFVAYGRSKTANALFAAEFDRRHRARGVRAASVHPGGIRTELSRHMSEDELARLIASINASRPPGAPPFHYKSVPQGAATTDAGRDSSRRPTRSAAAIAKIATSRRSSRTRPCAAASGPMRSIPSGPVRCGR